VYDVTCRASFDSIGMWLREVDTYSTSRDTVKLLVGNKIDKVRSTWRERPLSLVAGVVWLASHCARTLNEQADRQVSHEEGAAFARSRGMIFIETSAKTKVGIQQTFEELVQKVLPRALSHNPRIARWLTRLVRGVALLDSAVPDPRHSLVVRQAATRHTSARACRRR